MVAGSTTDLSIPVLTYYGTPYNLVGAVTTWKLIKVTAGVVSTLVTKTSSDGSILNYNSDSDGITVHMLAGDTPGLTGLYQYQVTVAVAGITVNFIGVIKMLPVELSSPTSPPTQSLTASCKSASLNGVDKVDLTLDEQTSWIITVTPTQFGGTVPYDLTGASSVVWVATDNSGTRQIKKDTATMTVALAPASNTYATAAVAAGQKEVAVAQVAGFGMDEFGQIQPDLVAGLNVNITDSMGQSETNTIASVDSNTLTLTMVNNLVNTYSSEYPAMVATIIPSFSFPLLPGDTVLPATKVYGTQIIWDHLAIVTFPASMSPGNIYAIPTTIVAVRGRMFIRPIMDMS